MIEVNNLVKKYGRHTAVDNISFSVSEKEILGFLGPNGAGKTTTMSIITGYSSATDGSVLINGLDVLDKPVEAKRHIGYLPDSPPVYGDMTVFEYLKFVCGIKQVNKRIRKQMIDEIMELVSITDMRNRLVKNLSKGYQQRVGLAQALVGYPEVLILDEPTVGLDPKQIIEMRNVIKNLGKNHTVLLSSHLLFEVSAVCDRVMIINKGKIVASGEPHDLVKNLVQKNKLSVRIKGGEDEVRRALTEKPFLVSLFFEGSREEGTVDIIAEGAGDTDIREDVFRALADSNLPIYQMKAVDMSLEEVFLQVTTDEPSGHEETDQTKELLSPCEYNTELTETERGASE